MDIIYEDEALQVVRQPGASPFTLITFADLTPRPNGRWFWGGGIAARLGLDAIGVVAKAENWYPVASVERAAEAVRAAAQPVRVGYGYSMGAHAVLKHGRRLALTHALAVAPQDSIDPAVVPEDRRFHRFFRPALHAGMEIGAADVAPWTAVVADPWDVEDAPHLRRLVALPAVVPVPTPFLGHYAIWLLASTPAIEAALQRVLARDAAGLQAVLRARRHRSVVHAARLGVAALARGHAGMGERMLHRAARLGAAEAALVGWRAEARVLRAPRIADRIARLEEAGRPEAARAVVDAWIPQAGDAGLLAMQGHRLIGRGHAARSEPLFRAALALDPRLALAHIGLSHALAAQGQFGPALDHAETGLSLDPAEAGGLAWVGILLLRLGQPVAAEARLRAALEMEPRTADAYLGLSQIRAAEDRPEAARAMVEQGLRLLPGHPALLRQADSLRQAPPESVAARDNPAPAPPRAARLPAPEAADRSWRQRLLAAMLAGTLLALAGTLLGW
ncbi:tetratricopeptide repeat protein [Roseicella aquatilis]|uniref:Tetratricopeptide repeat protein n=1 Tax=Roseicella aquatilis TaxID=2527868 RepID=A0A4R4DD30_9PROT|nr:tetratricopeptide repeat protein [Roseicella aquatilis]TCZ57257.1 tetratricopeptide repeat protein [Roseicella aquatilis]